MAPAIGVGVGPAFARPRRPSVAVVELAFPVDETNNVVSMWVGHTTSDSVIVTVSTDELTDETHLVVATDDEFANQVAASDPLTPDASHYFARGVVNGLQPNTRYYIGAAVDGTIDSSRVGTFKTPPVGPHSFSFAAASCKRTNSNELIFDNIAGKLETGDIDFMVELGDAHYQDPASDNVSVHHNIFNNILTTAKQNRYYRAGPIYYQKDDHEIANDHHAGTTGVLGFTHFFRARVPHPPLGSSDPDTVAYWSFTRGRVRFIAPDPRGERKPKGDTDDADKIIFSEDQEEWFFDELKAANTASHVAMWGNTFPWIAAPTAGADHWGGYTFARASIADFIEAEGLGPIIAQTSGDMHMLAYDSGINNDWGGFPVCHNAPLDQSNNSEKGGPYEVGSIATSQSQYGVYDVTDDGDGPIEVRFRGISVDRATGVETVQIDRTFWLVPANTAPIIQSVTISGAAVVDSTLTANVSVLANPAATLTYEWRRDEAAIAGATSSTYDLVEADEDAMITVHVTATNAEGADDLLSDAVGPIVDEQEPWEQIRNLAQAAGADFDYMSSLSNPDKRTLREDNGTFYVSAIEDGLGNRPDLVQTTISQQGEFIPAGSAGGWSDLDGIHLDRSANQRMDPASAWSVSTSTAASVAAGQLASEGGTGNDIRGLYGSAGGSGHVQILTADGSVFRGWAVEYGADDLNPHVWFASNRNSGRVLIQDRATPVTSGTQGTDVFDGVAFGVARGSITGGRHWDGLALPPIGWLDSGADNLSVSDRDDLLQLIHDLTGVPTA